MVNCKMVLENFVSLTSYIRGNTLYSLGHAWFLANGTHSKEEHVL